MTPTITLVHRLKSGGHEIPINAELALRPEAFATYTETKNGETRPFGLGWSLSSSQSTGADGKKGKYEGHSFELRLSPDHLRAFIHAAQVALQRFDEE
jgi:hypothetical protein